MSTDPQTDLRDRIADVLAADDGWTWVPGFDKTRSPVWQGYLKRAATVLAVLPPSVDRAAVLLEAAARLSRKAATLTEGQDDFAIFVGKARAAEAEILDREAEELRRLADEAQQQEPERPRCQHCGLPHDLTPSMELACASIRASIRDHHGAEAQQQPDTETPAEPPLHGESVAHIAGCQPGAGEAQEPVCQGFVWIGQPFTTCDRCARPAWEHEGEDVPADGAGPFDTRRTVRPWRPGQADAIRAKWDPQYAAGVRQDGAQR